VDREGFDFASDFPMIHQFDAANLGETHPVIMRQGETRLREGETVTAVLAAKAWISWLLTSLDATEEALNAKSIRAATFWQDLRVNPFEGGAAQLSGAKRFPAAGRAKGTSPLAPRHHDAFPTDDCRASDTFSRVSFKAFTCFFVGKIRYWNVLRMVRF
jgi:hypothetical protein